MIGGGERGGEPVEYIPASLLREYPLSLDGCISRVINVPIVIDQARDSYHIARLSTEFGIPTEDPCIMIEALTLAERATGSSNERLEWRGDAALQEIVSNYLYIRYPQEGEGSLTIRRSTMVSNANLSRVFIKHRLERFVPRSSRLDEPKLSLKQGADVVEALIGACRVATGGGLAAATDLVYRLGILPPREGEADALTEGGKGGKGQQPRAPKDAMALARSHEPPSPPCTEGPLSAAPGPLSTPLAAPGRVHACNESLASMQADVIDKARNQNIKAMQAGRSECWRQLGMGLAGLAAVAAVVVPMILHDLG